MNKNPLVSVLMPAYNAEKYISDSIESILNQTYKNFELLIADDCSTDTTYKIARSYEKKDRRVRVFKNKKNLDIGANRNFLILESKGGYIAWQDADDISARDRLKQQVAYLNKHGEVGIVGGFLEFFDESGVQNVRRYAQHDAELRRRIFRYSPVAQPTAMIRKEVLESIGIYGEDLSPAEDIDMSFRIGTKYKFANLQEITLKYRNYAESATYKKLRKIELTTLAIRAKYMFNKSYSFFVLDLLYNLLQLVSVFLIPNKLKIRIFNFLRNESIR